MLFNYRHCSSTTVHSPPCLCAALWCSVIQVVVGAGTSRWSLHTVRRRSHRELQSSGRTRDRDLYRPRVNWILKCKWLSLSRRLPRRGRRRRCWLVSFSSTSTGKRGHNNITNSARRFSIQYIYLFRSHATGGHDFLGHQPHGGIWMWLSCLAIVSAETFPCPYTLR